MLFADVSGSTRLYETLGDTAAHRVVVRLLDQLAGVVAAEGGRVVKRIGDELMSVFGDAGEAVEAACAMQHAFTRAVRSPDAPAGIRVGLHSGAVIEDDAGDLFGDTVNVAARLVGLSKPGQILISGATHGRLSPAVRDETRQVDRTRLRGRGEELDVFEVLWGRNHVTSFEEIVHPDAEPPPAALLLTFGTLHLRVSNERPTLWIGRDGTNDLAVPLRVVSRRHARIEWRRDRPLLVDQSTNGTLVVPDAAPPTFVRRHELLLEGSGLLAPGFEPTSHPDHVIRYACERVTNQ